MKLIKNIDVYAPEHLGKKDVLIIGDKIAKIEDAGSMPEIPFLTAEDVIDGTEKILTPGFIDCHVHVPDGVLPSTYSLNADTGRLFPS